VAAFTCQAERLEAELGAVQDDEAVRRLQPRRRVLRVALEVTRLLSRADLFDLTDVNCGHTHTETHIHSHTYTHTETHRQKHTHRNTHTQTETHTQKHTHTETHIQKHTQKHTHTDTETHTHTYKKTHTHRNTHTQTHTHRGKVMIYFSANSQQECPSREPRGRRFDPRSAH